MPHAPFPPTSPAALLGQIALAAGASLACFYSLFLFPLAGLPLAFVGLRHGARAAAVAAGLSVILASLIGQLAGVLVFMILVMMPMLILLLMSLQFSWLGTQMEGLVPRMVVGTLGLGMLMMSVAYLSLAGAEGGLPGILSERFVEQLSRDDAQSLLRTLLPAALTGDADFLRQATRFWLVFYPSFMLWIWLLQFGWARELAQRSGRVILARPDYLNWLLPEGLEIALALFLVLGALAPSAFAIYAFAAAALIGSAYVILGFSLLHLLVGGSTMRRIVLIGIYALCLAYLWLSVLIAFLGLLARPLNLHAYFRYWVKRLDETGKKD